MGLTLGALGVHFGSLGAHSGAPALATWLHWEAGGSPWCPIWEDFESNFASSRVMGNMLATKLRTCTKHHYTCTDCMCAPPLESSMFSHIGAKSRLRAFREVGELKRAPREHLEVHFGAVGNILGAIRAPVGAIRAPAQHCSGVGPPSAPCPFAQLYIYI